MKINIKKYTEEYEIDSETGHKLVSIIGKSVFLEFMKFSNQAYLHRKHQAKIRGKYNHEYVICIFAFLDNNNVSEQRISEVLENV